VGRGKVEKNKKGRRKRGKRKVEMLKEGGEKGIGVKANKEEEEKEEGGKI